MKKYETQVLVIGGGATGTGVLRDLAMRGFNSLLVEKSDLSTGTTGRYHGLLHSGGRYVVKDPQAAKECIEENQILRRIMPHCIEDTGGYFVQTPEDDPDYAWKFVDGCRLANIPVEEISTKRMLKEEPLLNPNIQRCFLVPDASADSFLGSEANVESAKAYGAEVLRYHEVKKILLDNNKVIGVKCIDILTNEEVEIRSELIVNASGAWAGKIAGYANINVQIIPGKGTMVAMNHRIVNTVINRCKMPSDGDILVPAHTVSVIGTTDVPVSDPDRYAIEPWEIQLLMKEGALIIPGFPEMRMVRAWAGVRPLYKETKVDDTRDVTRAFVLLDHEERDNVAGFITITSGKWTTYRKMAEVTVDLVCKKLDSQRKCQTHLEPLPISKKHGFHYLGSRLAKVENEKLSGQLICECELATYSDIRNVIIDGDVKSIDDIRRKIRLGMGPCQGGFCTIRAAGLFHKLRKSPIDSTNNALRDFLQERWKGLLPILWGQQLRQERLNELIYLSLFNIDHLPEHQISPIAPILYEESVLSDRKSKTLPQETIKSRAFSKDSSIGKKPDVLVIGAGLAGLSAAWASSTKGNITHLISKGQGSQFWHAGCIDVLGYLPGDEKKEIRELSENLEILIKGHPSHPYAMVGLRRIDEAISSFKSLCQEFEYRMHGSLDKNWLLPSSLGARRPTCLAPYTMIAGDLNTKDPMWIIGFDGYFDFYPELIAENLKNQGFPAEGITLDFQALRDTPNINSLTLANLLENEEFLEEVISEIKKQLSKNNTLSPERIGFPAILGINHTNSIIENLRNKLELPIFEIPTLPPSIPGIRLNNMMTQAIERSGGRINIGMEAIGCEMSYEDSSGYVRVETVWSEAAARRKPNRANKYILATGGLLGGGLYAQYSGIVSEAVFDLPVSHPEERTGWFQRQFISENSHPIFQSGITVDNHFQPILTDNKRISDLFIVGSTLQGYDPLRERSLDGVALVTGYHVGKNI